VAVDEMIPIPKARSQPGGDRLATDDASARADLAPVLPEVARGDRAAVGRCMARYGALVWSIARRLSPTPADAEDATQ
jgi:hypothetical protein